LEVNAGNGTDSTGESFTFTNNGTIG